MLGATRERPAGNGQIDRVQQFALVFSRPGVGELPAEAGLNSLLLCAAQPHVQRVIRVNERLSRDVRDRLEPSLDMNQMSWHESIFRAQLKPLSRY